MEVFPIHQRDVFLLLILHSIFYIVVSEPFIGVVFDTGIYNLPTPNDLSKFLNGTSITRVRMNYEENFIKAFQETPISSVILDATDNLDLPFMAISKEHHCKRMLQQILPNTDTFLIGDKVFESGDQSVIDALVPAMENLQSVFDDAGLRGKVKVSTVISTDSLTRSDIPSKAEFKADYYKVIVRLLQFLRKTRSPLHISTFPYYDYVAHPTPHILNLCLFQPNSGRLDPGTGKNYTNMFAIKVDSMRRAMDGLGFQDIEIVVAETGWPSSRNATQFAGSLTQARQYNWNLIHYIRSMVGTPLMPNKPVITYIYSLFDGVLVPDELKSCGFINTDLSWKYDLLCLKR